VFILNVMYVFTGIPTKFRTATFIIYLFKLIIYAVAERKVTSGSIIFLELKVYQTSMCFIFM